MTERDLTALIDRPQETKQLDFKRPMRWNTSDPACMSLVADVLGMANSGGGTIVIGVSEDDNAPTGWRRTGLTPEDVSTWDQTTVGEVLRRYAGGPIDFTIDRVAREEGVFVVISVPAFTKHPYVCGHSFEEPDVKGEKRFKLRQLAVYVRTHAAQTVALRSSEHFLELIELAIRLRRDELLSLIGQEAGEPSLTLDQYLILSAILQAVYDQDFVVINTNDLDASALQGLSRNEVHERIEELERRGLLRIVRRAGTVGFDIQITPEGIQQGTRDFEQVADRVRREICRLGSTTAQEIAEILSLPPLLVKQVVADYASNDLVSHSTTTDMTKVWRPRDELCGWEKRRPLKACLVIGPHFQSSGSPHRPGLVTEVDILNEGDHDARDVQVFWDTGEGFPSEENYAPLHPVIPGKMLEPNRRYRSSFFMPWPDVDAQGEPIQGQERTVRLKLRFRDGIGEIDEAVFTLQLNNRRDPKWWATEEVKIDAQLSPICRRSRVESW